MENYKQRFLEKNLLGQDVDLNDEDAVIKKCIRLAYNDMLTAGKYYIKYVGKDMNIDSISEGFKVKLEQNNYVFSRNLIKQTLEIFGKDEQICENANIKKNKKGATRYGLAQKLVNMTFKYLYVFSEYLPNITINYNNCDCPLDSIIIKNLTGNDKIKWSKIEEEDYINLQNQIAEKLTNVDSELKNLSNLAYDFIAWNKQ